MLLIVEVAWSQTPAHQSLRTLPDELAAVWAGPSGLTFEVFQEQVSPAATAARQSAIAASFKQFLGLYAGPSDMLACWDPDVRFDLARWCQRVAQDDILTTLHTLNLDNAFAASMKLKEPVPLDQALALTRLRTPVDTLRPLHRAMYMAKLLPWVLGNVEDQRKALEREESGADSTWQTLGGGTSRFASI